VQQNLRGLFERALDDEPLPPPGDPVEEAMTRGRRIRRRRGLLIGGTATAVIAATTVAVNLALAPAAPPPQVSMAAMLMPPASATCTWPVQDNASKVAVFLTDTITVGEINTLGEALWRDPAVRDVQFESRYEAYEKFKKLWADSPDFVASVTVDNLPQSYRVELAQPSGYRDFAARVRSRPGVQDLVGESCPGTSK
jgi:hypothetical protein